MAAPSTMQREAVGLPAVEPVGLPVALMALALRLGLCAPGDESRQTVARLLLVPAARLRSAAALRPVFAAAIGLALALRKRLRLARDVGLRLAGAERRVAAARLLATLVFRVVGEIVARLLLRPVIGVGLAELLLGGRDHAEIVLGVLEIILRPDRIARCLRIAGELDVLVGDMRGRAANLHVGAIRFVHARQRVLALAVAPTHALILTVSHGLLSKHSHLRRLKEPPVASQRSRNSASTTNASTTLGSARRGST